MKVKLCDISSAVTEKTQKMNEDKSGIGIHFVDAYLKPFNTKLPDGTPVKAKRRGLKLTLNVGTRKGEGLMRRLANGPTPATMLDAALQEAAKSAGIELAQEQGAIYLSIPDAPVSA
ncbi:MAG TPA: hypothetical protein VGN88_01725 [Phycisphaerae bacterium]|jgi:hypothetical protein